MNGFGTVAIFATLFTAIYFVNGVKSCGLEFGINSEFDLECNNVKNTWTVKEDLKDSPDKTVFVLAPQKDGCMRTKDSVALNSTVKVSFTFLRDAPKDDAGKVTLRLVPKEGSCPDEECLWDVTSDSQFKPGEWITAEYKFPVKSTKDYFVQLQVDKSKGKFLMDNIKVPIPEEDLRCGLGIQNEINLPKKLTAAGAAAKNKSAAIEFAEISKNLLVTSASVLTLSNLLN